MEGYGACCAECGVWANSPEEVIHAETCSLALEQAEEFHALAHEFIRENEKRLKRLRRLS